MNSVIGSGLAAFAMVLSSAPVAAADRTAEVIVHVDNCARAPANALAGAKRYVERVFADAGVLVSWADGPLEVATARRHGVENGPRRLGLVISNAETIETRWRSPDGVMGHAAPVLGRAHVFFDRLLRELRRQPADLGRMLGHVIAHELGHLLLPPHSHGSSGVMRGRADFREPRVRTFTEAEARQIRAALKGGDTQSWRSPGGRSPSNLACSAGDDCGDSQR